MGTKQVRALLLQIRQMAVNGWSEGIDPRGQCGHIVSRIDEWTEAHLDELIASEACHRNEVLEEAAKAIEKDGDAYGVHGDSHDFAEVVRDLKTKEGA